VFYAFTFSPVFAYKPQPIINADIGKGIAMSSEELFPDPNPNPNFSVGREY